MNSKNTFKGEDAIINYLDPAEHVTPLVELPKAINPFYDDGIKIFAKLLQHTALANVKSIPAFNMLQNLQKNGKLENIDTIVESSSGNTVMSLALIARQYGINHTKALVSNEVSNQKLRLLKLAGIECEVRDEPICPDPQDTNSSINRAKEMASEEGYLNPGQYSDFQNPQAHENITAPQIYDQLDGDLQIFTAGLGTTGTVVGCSSYFKKQNKNILTIGVVRNPNNPVPGVRTLNLLNICAFDWKNSCGQIESVDTKSSYFQSMILIRQGILAGPSSGLNLAGLLQFLQSAKSDGTLDKHRNSDGIINCVFICCDAPFIYIDEYFDFLDDKYFPEVLGQDNLDNVKKANKVEVMESKNLDISPKELFSKIYQNEKDGLKLSKNCSVIDVREPYEFEDASLPLSINIPLVDILSGNNEVEPFKNKEIYLVCRSGGRSNQALQSLKQRGFNVFNLKGGMIEWTNERLPRQKSKSCGEPIA